MTKDMAFSERRAGCINNSREIQHHASIMHRSIDIKHITSKHYGNTQRKLTPTGHRRFKITLISDITLYQRL